MTAEFWFRSDNFEISNLPIVKVEQFNIADAYILLICQWERLIVLLHQNQNDLQAVTRSQGYKTFSFGDK